MFQNEQKFAPSLIRTHKPDFRGNHIFSKGAWLKDENLVLGINKVTPSRRDGKYIVLQHSKEEDKKIIRNMRNKNLILRYFGLFLLVVGIILNVKMYIDEAWPTYLFFIISVIGIIQIIASFVSKQMKVSWQIHRALLPVVLGFIYLNL